MIRERINKNGSSENMKQRYVKHVLVQDPVKYAGVPEDILCLDIPVCVMRVAEQGSVGTARGVDYKIDNI
jgi:hypothetical protein